MKLISNNQFEQSDSSSDLQREIDERDEALDELTGILGGSLSCPSFVPSGKKY
jgi:hypothetical protein